MFDTMFVLQPVNFSSFGMEELKIEYIHYNSKISRFDLLMQAYEDKEKLYFIVEYSTKLFKMETIQRMLNHFQTMISVMAKDIDTIVDEIDFVSDAEEQTLMDQLEVTAYDF